MAVTTPESEMLAAWSRFASTAWDVRGDQDATDQSIADENLLALGIASTPHAVAAKLRYSLYVGATSPWMEAAALGAVVPEIDEKLMVDGTVNEAIWSSIQSLEAMAVQS